MMLRNGFGPLASLVAVSVLFLGLFAHGASGQSGVRTPKAGSAERKAIMDALRVPVERDVHQSVIFVVTKLNVERGFAFVITQPQRPNGKRIDYRHTKYADAQESGAFDDQAIALLKKRGSRWRVLVYNIGATDVVWEDWGKRYGAPSAIFK
jgi:hypothetical protein